MADTKATTKRYRQKHRKEIREYIKSYFKTEKGYIRKLWNNIIQRCTNSKSRSYKYYGGRGIKVKFISFGDFYDYVANELKVDPRGLTIDRINNDGNYEKGNIRFVTRTENNRNKRLKYSKDAGGGESRTKQLRSTAVLPLGKNKLTAYYLSKGWRIATGNGSLPSPTLNNGL